MKVFQRAILELKQSEIFNEYKIVSCRLKEITFYYHFKTCTFQDFHTKDSNKTIENGI